MSAQSVDAGRVAVYAGILAFGVSVWGCLIVAGVLIVSQVIS